MMQTSAFLPVSLFTSQPAEAAYLLPLLPKGSEVDTLSHPYRRQIYIAHDAESARHYAETISALSPWQQAQALLVLPANVQRLSPPCAVLARPVRLAAVQKHLSHCQNLPIEIACAQGLTPTESAILQWLTAQAPEPLSAEQLQHSIWQHHESVESRTLETHLYRLRKKIEGTGWSIITDNGQYYLQSELTAL